MKGLGKRTWVFADGDLPPAGSTEPRGHEALMVVNTGDRPAVLTFDFHFEEAASHRGVAASVPAGRVRCFRLDAPVGDQAYRVPRGQYALVVRSSVPVVAVFGRLDVRQPNLAYYGVQGFSV